MRVVGIQFRKEGKIYNYDTNGLKLSKYDTVIVNSEKGLQYANVVGNPIEIELKDELQKVVRIATEQDKNIYEENLNISQEAMVKADEVAKSLNLSMNFVKCTYNFERSQLMFFYFADSRVDFRQLAKTLASIYKTRIELRQIGVRDKAKEISGIGLCGRKLCCSLYLKDLDSVTISMAKNQNLSLNPNKINGLCGRLLCCLNYENELYEENRKKVPEIGKKVKVDDAEGYVVSVDVPNLKYTVSTQDKGNIQVDASK